MSGKTNGGTEKGDRKLHLKDGNDEERDYDMPRTHRSAVSVCLQREPHSAACQWASGP